MRSVKFTIYAATLMIAVSSAFAATRMPYEASSFETALETGKPVLVHVTAPWCGECPAQKPIVAGLAKQPEYKDLTIVDVDFDTQKDALRRLRVQKQSTLVIFSGKKEVARSVGITRVDAIEGLVKKGF